MAGFAGRCKHRPLRMWGRFLASFAGYLRREPAMHPSGCALRRIQRPVCGARIALRALKHTCVLRPLRYREAVKTGAVSEGRSYAFYRRTGDNKRSDGRLPHEKQLSPPQAALDSAAPCRGAFQAVVTRKAGKTNTARNTAVPGCIVLYRDPGQGVLIRKSLRQTADGTSPPMGGNLAPRRRTLPAQIVLEGRCVKFNHLRAVKKQWITGGCACAGQPDRRQRRPQRER